MSEKKIATLDCETDPFCFGRVPKPFLWCIYDGREYHLYNDTKDVLKWLEGFDGIVYAHNGGKFDYHFLLDGIPNGTQVMVINGRIARLKLGKAQLRDSYNILPIPLAMMEKDDFEYWKMESSCRAQHMPEITQYLKNDCLYLHNYITQFIDMFGLHITQASCAFKKLHEIIGQDMPKKYGATGHRYYDFIKPFYFGGRVSCFKPGVHKGNFHYIDINSSYPFAMKHKHPWGSKHVTQKNIPDSKLHRSFLEVNCFSHGAFPFRDGLKTDFPHRQDTYFVTGYEFMAALETDTISDVKIKKGYVFKESIEFGAYVDKFFAMKKEAEENDRPADRLFAKLFLNSSYGKFGMNGEKHEQYSFEDIYPDWQKIEQWTKDGTKWKAHEIVAVIGYIVFRCLKKDTRFMMLQLRQVSPGLLGAICGKQSTRSIPRTIVILIQLSAMAPAIWF